MNYGAVGISLTLSRENPRTYEKWLLFQAK